MPLRRPANLRLHAHVAKVKSQNLWKFPPWDQHSNHFGLVACCQKGQSCTRLSHSVMPCLGRQSVFLNQLCPLNRLFFSGRVRQLSFSQQIPAETREQHGISMDIIWNHMESWNTYPVWTTNSSSCYQRHLQSSCPRNPWPPAQRSQLCQDVRYIHAQCMQCIQRIQGFMEMPTLDKQRTLFKDFESILEVKNAAGQTMWPLPLRNF